MEMGEGTSVLLPEASCLSQYFPAGGAGEAPLLPVLGLPPQGEEVAYLPPDISSQRLLVTSFLENPSLVTTNPTP